jgi:hypothetical protein
LSNLLNIGFCIFLTFYLRSGLSCFCAGTVPPDIHFDTSARSVLSAPSSLFPQSSLVSSLPWPARPFACLSAFTVAPIVHSDTNATLVLPRSSSPSLSRSSLGPCPSSLHSSHPLVSSLPCFSCPYVQCPRLSLKG